LIELNNFLVPDKDTIVDDSIICPNCKSNKSLKVYGFTFNVANNNFNENVKIGCTACWSMFNMDKIKITEEEYTEVHKRLRFSKQDEDIETIKKRLIASGHLSDGSKHCGQC
jgi:hypothetical protein